MRYSPIDENHPEFPVDIYSANKTASEKYVLVYGSAYGIPVTVVRLGNTFGPRANIKNPALGFVNYFVGLALQNKPVTVYGTGEQLRNVSYVQDSIAALILASQSEAANGEVFFATGDLQYSVAHIAEEIARTVGAGYVQFVDWPENRQNIDVGDAVVSNAKIKRVLGWMPRYDLSAGLVQTRDYFTAHLDQYLQSGSYAPYGQP
jgi:UDP-glucose 4-epimerase